MIDFFFRPARHSLSKKSASILEKAVLQRVDYKGRSIQTYKWTNDGPLVYLAHGWDSRGLHFYSLIEQLYEAGYSVFTFDGVAHGESEGKSTSFIEFTDLNHHFLSQMQTPLVLIGHSMGGASLINIAHELNLNIPMVLFAPMFSIAKVLENIKKRHKMPGFLLNLMIRTIERSVGRKTTDLETIDKVPHFKSPALIFHDPDDKMTYWNSSKKLETAWPGCELIAAQGLGHSRIIRDPQLIQRTLQFIEQN